MKIFYDQQVDAAYIRLSNKEPEGVIEISEGVNLDVSEDGKIIGIEILDAARKINIQSLFTYEVDKASYPNKREMTKTTGK
jgi:uncharacterized protein YuzE